MDPEACVVGLTGGILCLVFVGGLAYAVCLPWSLDPEAPRVLSAIPAAVAIGDGLLGLRVLYMLSGRIAVDEDGITCSSGG